SWRSHQVPLANARDTAEHLRILEDWMRSYRPEELFDTEGRPLPTTVALAPEGERRMSANPVANGGLLRTELELPDFRDYAVPVTEPGATVLESTAVLGRWLADVIRETPGACRSVVPDETAAKRLAPAVYEDTDKRRNAELRPGDGHLARAGRVMEVLSEHQCEGWLEGY